jgi:hypothetical protein
MVSDEDYKTKGNLLNGTQQLNLLMIGKALWAALAR